MNNQDIDRDGSGRVPVAVIILNWNGAKLLREYLPAVLATTNSSIGRVIVADNGSTDDSLQVLRDEFPDVEVLSFESNLGFAAGYNRAIAETGYELTVLLNSDVKPDYGWLDGLYAYMCAHEDCGACQPKIMSLREPTRFEYAGACGGFIDRHGYPYCRGRIFGDCETDYGQYDSERDVFWASGAALMVRSELYLKVGGLDPAFFAHMEEIDLCWRIRLEGYKVSAVPSARVFHLGGGSLPAENPRKTYLNFRNNLLMLHKNLPDGVRGVSLLTRRLLDTVAWAKYVVTFKWKHAGAIFRAHRDFAKMRRAYTAHPEYNLLAVDPESSVNIITAYYLRGRKKFSEL